MSALQRVPSGVSVVLLDLSSVPAMDATGLVSLEAAVSRLQGMGIFVVLTGVQDQPMRVLARSGIHRRPGRIAVFRSMERAMAAARDKSRLGREGEVPPGEMAMAE
jgi:SulP family sulfate permease